jgi:hypothetical protein
MCPSDCPRNPASAVPDLVAILEREAAPGVLDENRKLAIIVTTLGRIGPAADAASAQLDELLRRDDVNLSLRATLLTALARIKPRSAVLVPRFLELITEIRDEGSSDPLSHLGEFPELADAIQLTRFHRFVLADLAALCECNVLSYSCRLDAAITVLHIDPQNGPARRYLEWARRHGDWLIRSSAEERIEELEFRFGK